MCTILRVVWCMCMEGSGGDQVAKGRWISQTSCWCMTLLHTGGANLLQGVCVKEEWYMYVNVFVFKFGTDVHFILILYTDAHSHSQSPRYLHSAVLFGSLMLTYGGCNRSPSENILGDCFSSDLHIYNSGECVKGS